MRPLTTERRFLLILTACIIIHGLSNWLWASSYKQFPQRKEVKYLSCAFAFDPFFRHPGLTTLDQSLKHMHPFYPPLYFFLVRVAAAGFGDTYRSFLLVNSLASFILFFSVYYVGKKLLSPLSGQLAALVLACSPQLASYARLTTHSYAESSFTAAAVAAVAWAGRFQRGRRAVIAGGVIALAMLVKWTIVVYVVGMFLVQFTHTVGDAIRVDASRRPVFRLRRLGFLLALAPWSYYIVKGWPWRIDSAGCIQTLRQLGVLCPVIVHMAGLWLVLWLMLRMILHLFVSRVEPYASWLAVPLQVFMTLAGRGPFHQQLPWFFGLLGDERYQALAPLASSARGGQFDISVLAFAAPGIVVSAYWLLAAPLSLTLPLLRVRLRPLARSLMGYAVAMLTAGVLFGGWYVRYVDKAVIAKAAANNTGVHFGYQLFYVFTLLYFELTPVLALLLPVLASCRPRDRGVQSVAMWYLAPLLIYSFIILADKEPYRMLPALPAVALLLGHGLALQTAARRRLLLAFVIPVGLFFHAYPFLADRVRLHEIPIVKVVMGGPELIFGKFMLDPPDPGAYLPQRLPHLLQESGLTGEILITMSRDLIGERFLSEWNWEYYKMQYRREGWKTTMIVAPPGDLAVHAASDIIILPHDEIAAPLRETDETPTRVRLIGWNPIGEKLCIIEPDDEYAEAGKLPGGGQAAVLDELGQRAAAEFRRGECCLILADRAMARRCFELPALQHKARQLRRQGLAFELVLTQPELPVQLWQRAQGWLLELQPGHELSFEPYPPLALRDCEVYDLTTAAAVGSSQVAASDQAHLLLILKRNAHTATFEPPGQLLASMLVADNPVFLYDVFPVYKPAKKVEIWRRSNVNEEH